LALILVAACIAAIVVPSPARAGDHGRSAVAGPYGDFNGDGYHDLAVGVPYEDVFKSAVTFEDAGLVQVIYGSASGLNGDSPVDDQIWHQGSPGVLGGLEALDHFGSSLAWGDFNGDGYDDLAVGVPFEDHDVATPESGAVNVLFGSASGLTGTGSQFLEQGAGLLDSAERLDYFGSTLTAGSFGNGSRADLAIGVPREDLPGSHGSTIADAGAVSVVYGSPSGLTTAGNQFLTECSLACVPGTPVAEDSDQFGRALAAGNFGNGSASDLAIGAPFEDLGGSLSVGAVTVMYGSPGGLTDTGQQYWNPDLVAGNGAEEGDIFGYALAAADLGGTPQSDLAVGVPGDREEVDGAGSVSVLYGSLGGLSASGSQSWNQDTPGVPNAANSNDSFGRSLVAADFGNGSAADVAIGFNDVDLAGALIVLYGTSGGLSAAGAQEWSQNSTGIADKPEGEDGFSFTLAAADFGKSPHADLAVGVSGEGFERAGLDVAGAVHVIYGTSAGLSAAGSQFWSQRSPGLKDSAEYRDRFGDALA
jgi:FG-GAP repeat protein